MKKRIFYILTTILCLTWGADYIYAGYVVRYVSPTGVADPDPEVQRGSEWGNAYNDLQAAIDEISTDMAVRNGDTGYVFVAGAADGSAIYVPTRKITNEAGNSTANTSFRIYPGIYVIGGFKGDEEVPSSTDPEYAYCKKLKDLPKMRWLNSETPMRSGDLMALHDKADEGGVRSWDLKYKSILSGNHHTNNFSFRYDAKRGIYNTTFPLSSFHVVWFGTAGVIDPSEMDDEDYTPYAPNIEGIDPETQKEGYVDIYGGVYYKLDKTTKTAIVTRGPEAYTGAISILDNIVIGEDESAVTYKVTEIRNGAFANCTELTSVTIGSNVKSIGQAAFYGCTGLTSVTLNEGLKNIYRFAFYGCNNAGFTSITFPSTIVLIDRWAFGGCSHLEPEVLPETINYIGRYAFRGADLPEDFVLPNYEKEEVEMTGRYKGLPRKAKLAGFTIEGGNASSTNLYGHDHAGYGGGVYMVRNTEIEDCIIHHCSATQRGGGVYLDGGGDVNYCYIHTCQATGYGMQQGYGGGVCIDYDGQVEHCYIVQCAGRAGAGLAICHDPDEYPEESAMQDETFVDAYESHEDQEASAYDPFAKSTIIANCTSNAEGAGVYLNYGGSLDHLTVVNNECIGPDVIYYGMRHGRTGGIYVREAGAIYNTAVWGNKCAVNSDIQFAAFKKEDYYVISVDHSAFSKGDITDWSAVTRKAVINLNDQNFPDEDFNTGNFPMFYQPTGEFTYQYQIVDGKKTHNLVLDGGEPVKIPIPADGKTAGILHENGVVDPLLTNPGEPYQDPYNWHPLGMSSMRGKGKQIVDVTIATKAELLHANADRDVAGIKFESVSVCGAVTNTYHSVQYVMAPSIEHLEGRIQLGENEEIPLIPTLFVDPNKVATGPSNTDDVVGYNEDQPLGMNWEHPLNNLQDAVYYFSQYLEEDKLLKKYKKEELDVDVVKDADLVAARIAEIANGIAVSKDQYNSSSYPTKQTIYKLPSLDSDGEDDFEFVQILVKEGSMNVAGRGAYLTGHIRTAAVRPVSNMRLYGGYPTIATGTTTSGRSPYAHKTEVRADVTGGDFNDHSVHVFSIANHHDVIVDGFRMVGGNGNIAPPDDDSEDAKSEWEFYNSVANGGGLAMNNANEAFPRDMTGNILRNCVIANCAAPEGAGIYVNGNAEHGSVSGKCKAELTVVNTVIRNCTAGDTWDDPDKYVAKENESPKDMKITLNGVVVANGAGAKIIMRNTDVMNNCGFPFKCEPIESRTYPIPVSKKLKPEPDAGHIEVYNSVIFCNGLRIHADRGNITNTVFCPKESWYNVTGEYIYMGYDVLLPNDYVGDGPKKELEERLLDKNIYRILTHIKSEDNTYLYHRVDNQTQQGKWGNHYYKDTPWTNPETGKVEYDDPKEDADTELADATKVKVRYPYFVNPSRNVGHSTTDDKSFYGGAVNYEPLPTNPIVNAANADAGKDSGTGIVDSDTEWPKYMGYDIDLSAREYGGDPDIGAIETHKLPANGAVYYVTPDGAGKRDGSSWANAIAGNTVYVLKDVYGPALADGDKFDTKIVDDAVVTISDRILDSNGDPVLTTDEKYCGGFGRSWFTSNTKQITASGASYKDYIVRKTIKYGGPNEGEQSVPDPSPTETNLDDGTTTELLSAGYYFDPRYPYGEISGASRTFWRANPYTGTYSNYTSRDNFVEACISNGWINNTREERYVSGLQYAVEKASKYNTGTSERIDGVDYVQVWVSNGIYTDYKGFVMRDKTTVMGGFPAKDGGTPGLTERQALMADPTPLVEGGNASVKIPKSMEAEEKRLNPRDYETILQISEDNPKTNNTTINAAAVKFYDNDLSIEQDITVSGQIECDRLISEVYRWNVTSHIEEDVTETYYTTSYFRDDEITHEYLDGTEITPKNPKNPEAEGVHVLTFGTPTGSQADCWHLTYTGKASTKDSNGVIGRYETNQMSGKDNNEKPIYENGQDTNEKTTENRIWLHNGSLAGVQAWQDMNLPAGNYMIKADLTAYYRLNRTIKYTDETGVTFEIIPNGGDPISQPLKAKGKGKNGANLGRAELCRYTFSFNQPTNGPVRIRINIGELISASGDNREVSMENFKLIKVTETGEYELIDETDERTPRPESEENYIVTNVNAVDVVERRTLRKRVLSMPDVCVPTYGGGGIGDPVTHQQTFTDDELPHTDRVSTETWYLRKAALDKDKKEKYRDKKYVEYSNVYWDGFTIRHGFLKDEAMCHGGGAGVIMYEGAHLRNCLVVDNFAGSQRNKGGGVFCDGATSTIENCFILNNTSTGGWKTFENQIFAGGLFMYEGTCFNTLIANNYSRGFGGGLGLCVGNFFNNTVAYNSSYQNNGGIRIAKGAKSAILMANSIIYGNNGAAITMTESSDYSPFLNCYVQSATTITSTTITNAIDAHNEVGDKNYGQGNKFENGASPSALNTPFEADYYNGEYSAGRAKSENDFRLRSSFEGCINKGTEDFVGGMWKGFREKGIDESQIPGQEGYKAAQSAEKYFPDNDVAYADRIQDCRIDIGAYEFDGTREIEPTLYPDKKLAVFYVTQNGSGMADAHNPENAACAIKLQKVLDAAGRWRFASYWYDYKDDKPSAENYPYYVPGTEYKKDEDIIYLTQKDNNFDDTRLRKELQSAGVASGEIATELAKLRDYEVIVKLEGDDSFSYTPTRSANPNEGVENILMYTLIVPHGIRVEGGYDPSFDMDPENPQPRDILGRTTILDGTNEVDGQAYHVVTFTNTLYTAHELKYPIGTKDIEDQLAFLSYKKVVGSYTVDRYPWEKHGYDEDKWGELIPGYKPMTDAQKKAAVENYWKENIVGYITKNAEDKAAAIETYCEEHIDGYTPSLLPEEKIAAKEVFFESVIPGYKELPEGEKSGAKTSKMAEIIADYNTKYPNAWVENQRVVLDGLFIQNGDASGSEEYYQNGGGAIVTGYAHIRNSVIQNNKAAGCGGGLYLDSCALVSGCIIKNNSAKYGGGIYVFEPEIDVSDEDAKKRELFAHAISSTIANNTATVSAGGLFFATNVRANSIAIWHNSANANPNVAGTDATGMTQLVENYPMNYCGVESRRMAGVNNIELPAEDSYGVRWDKTMWYETGDGQNYFPITMASVLTRTGMPYSSYMEYMIKYPTMELTDIFGLNRMAQKEEGTLVLAVLNSETHKHETYTKEKKDNNFIEIGARVLNADFHVDLKLKHIMKRLFVTTTERLPTTDAVALQTNTKEAQWKLEHPGVEPPSKPGPDPTTEEETAWNAYLDQLSSLEGKVEMYKQMGSCFLNPMLRLSDALDYIISVRKSDDPIDPDDPSKTVGGTYKDERFEIFICGGTFYPYRDAYGVQGESRANTFVVPEGVTIVGGVNPEVSGHAYCQEGYDEDMFLPTVSVAGRTLYGKTTYNIRTIREHQDRNGNNVNEPWEMEEQTILSGAAVQNDSKANVYHVITCISDSTQVGHLPTRKDSDGKILAPLYSENLAPSSRELLDNIEEESKDSRDKRTIIIDGVTITGGYANKIDMSDVSANAQTLTYFRGGGILVEGNWDAFFEKKSDLPEVLGVAKRDIPLIITSCLIKDNVAGNGGGVYTNGTFYSFGCHFTQNLAIGPVTKKDQEFIPWSAGGAIAANYECHVWNTLFDNNEAQRSIFDIIDAKDPKTGASTPMRKDNDGNDVFNPILNANERQGYGGVISSSETSLVRACNCDFVRNKAVAYPAIYNFIDNNLRGQASIGATVVNPEPGSLAELQQTMYNMYGKGWHFAVNSIFWGNQATATDAEGVAPATGFENEYYEMLYGNEDWEKPIYDDQGKMIWPGERRKPRHVANFGPLLDVATLTFCSYQEETGREGTVWLGNQGRAKSAPLKDKGTMTGLERLYAGDFVDVLEDYFGYYPDLSPQTPFCKVDEKGHYLPCAATDEDAQILQTSGILRDPSGDEINSAIAYNYNLVLDKENTAVNGPYFTQPSLSAGVDGYMETASWLVSRLNRTIDTGWGFLKQQVTQPDISSGLYETRLLEEALDDKGKQITYCERYYIDEDEEICGEEKEILVPYGKVLSSPVFSDVEDAEDDAEGHRWHTRILESTSFINDPEINNPEHVLEMQYHNLYGEGFYNLHSKNAHVRFHHMGYPDLLPMGEDTYMTYVHEGETESRNMRRISTHPKMGVQDVYIDMGIYEYQYVQLVTAGEETDVIWVAETSRGSGDGSSCGNATNELQEAIETLLRSRNDHDKMIKIIGGKYTPPLTSDNQNKAFFIEVPSRTDGITLPKRLNSNEEHSVKSLTIRGGYSPEMDDDLNDGESERDFERYPVVFEMTNEIGDNFNSTTAHLFIIEDAEEKACYMNYLDNKNKEFKDNVMPIVLDGITFVNPYGGNVKEGGAAIYYKEQKKWTERPLNSNNYVQLDNILKPATYEVEVDEETVTRAIPKLILKNCVVVASGVDEEVSAVKIEKGGGPALIANTVFHSNSGSPLVAVNTNVVNCTFALNGGHLKLVDAEEDYDPENTGEEMTYGCSLHNSIIWQDDLAKSKSAGRRQWEGDLWPEPVVEEEVVVHPANMTYNAYTQWDVEEEAWTIPEKDIKIGTENTILHEVNKNVFLGPNFVDPVGVMPESGSDTEKQLELKRSRNFHINPSARIINKAHAATYCNLVPFYAEQSLQKQITLIKDSKETTYFFHSVQRLDRPTVVEGRVDPYDPEPLQERNLKGTETVSDISSLVAPYPFRQSVTTVEVWNEDADPAVKTIVSTTPAVRTLLPYTEHELATKCRYEGSGMERGAYECVAALQRVLYVKDGAPGKQDGSTWNDAFHAADIQTAIDVAAVYTTVRDDAGRAYVFVKSDKDGDYGEIEEREDVSVFGGITFDREAEHTGLNGEYTDQNIEDYIKLLCAAREPIAAKGALKSVITRLKPADSSGSEGGFLLDGFEIVGGDALAASPVVLDNKTVVKNCIITGNSITSEGNVPVINIKNGLLYNTLVYGNNASGSAAVVNLGANGYMLNCTVVPASGKSGLSVVTDSNQKNNIVSASGGSMFAPYLKNANKSYDLTGYDYLTEHEPYHYQLIESSSEINAGEDDNGAGDGNTIKDGGNSIAKAFSDFVDFSYDRDPLGNPRRIGGRVDNGCFETWKVEGTIVATNSTDVTFSTNYGGHEYPHKGSVVYVTSGGNLVFGLDNERNPRFTIVGTPGTPGYADNAVKPGYVLVKDGGSIYGQGNTLEFNYVAAEKNFDAGAKFGLISMPFDYNLAATPQPESFEFDVYVYDAEGRSAYNYIFKSGETTGEESALWKDDLTSIQKIRNESGQIKRSEGWLLRFQRDEGLASDYALRFTGWGKDVSTYVYSESGDYKTVKLEQHDHRISSSSESALDFTRAEDMGWNLKGLPYLVSNYKTYDSNDPVDGEDYNMNIPHIYYKMGGNGEYIKKIGEIFTEESWISGSTLALNEAFFTQTSVIDVESGENLVFKVPVITDGPILRAPARPIVLMRDLDNEGDLLTVNPDEGAPKTINYSLGRDGVKWMTTDAPQLYLLTASHSRLSLLGAAPTEVDIPLGVYVPEDPRYADMPRYFTFSLPEPEAFENYQRVWLIDKALNRVTNLVDQTYAAALSPGTDNSRFYLRIGGFPFGNDQRREYIVYAWKRQLHIRGLVEGDQIRVYSLTGQLVLSTTARDPEFTAELPQAGGIYAVRVNDFSTKVRNL